MNPRHRRDRHRAALRVHSDLFPKLRHPHVRISEVANLRRVIVRRAIHDGAFVHSTERARVCVVRVIVRHEDHAEVTGVFRTHGRTDEVRERAERRIVKPWVRDHAHASDRKEMRRVPDVHERPRGCFRILEREERREERRVVRMDRTRVIEVTAERRVLERRETRERSAALEQSTSRDEAPSRRWLRAHRLSRSGSFVRFFAFVFCHCITESFASSSLVRACHFEGSSKAR